MASLLGMTSGQTPSAIAWELSVGTPSEAVLEGERGADPDSGHAPV